MQKWDKVPDEPLPYKDKRISAAHRKYQAYREQRIAKYVRHRLWLIKLSAERHFYNEHTYMTILAISPFRLYLAYDEDLLEKVTNQVLEDACIRLRVANIDACEYMGSTYVVLVGY